MKIFDYLFPTEERQKETALRKAEDDAQDIYQLREYDGKLWLTYNGFLICPSDMLNQEDPVKSLQEIRKLYVERNAISK